MNVKKTYICNWWENYATVTTTGTIPAEKGKKEGKKEEGKYV